MNSITTKSEAVIVHGTVLKLFMDKPYFKSCELDKDDAGVHITLHVQRSALPAEGSPKVGVINGVRVCVAVHG